jgi:hypothetical protein
VDDGRIFLRERVPYRDITGDSSVERLILLEAEIKAFYLPDITLLPLVHQMGLKTRERLIRIGTALDGDESLISRFAPGI